MDRLIITDNSSGQRLDVYLAGMYPTISRSYWQKQIAGSRVRVNGKSTKHSYKLNRGDEVTVEPVEELTEPVVEAENIPLNILYEDKDIIVVDKARGMVVHPAAGNSNGTLVNALLYHCRDLSGINGVIRPGIVHRLDKDTSGVMVVAKNDKAHISLAEQISTKTARREYLALVHGNIKENAGIITGNIGRHHADRQKMAIVANGGKTATTNFFVKKRYGKYTLVSCVLDTGRTHQIRVHMTGIGHPLVGDSKYTGAKNPFAIKGQALHSYKLELMHPVTGEAMTFEAPVPEDMAKIIRRLDNQIYKN